MTNRILDWLRRLVGKAARPHVQATLYITMLIVAVIIVVTSLLNRDFRSLIWSTRMMDAVVGLTIIWVALMLPLISLSLSRDQGRSDEMAVMAGERLPRHATAVIIIATLFVTYGIFRNQAKLAADASLNDEVMQLYSIEMETDEVRCIYHNYGHDDPAVCLRNLISSSTNWTKAIFYVEETWYALRRSEEEFVEWGSNYSRSLAFWSEDLERDPTGIFAYYLVASSETPSEAVAEMRASGVYPKEGEGQAWKHLCGRYANVWKRLGSHRPKAYPYGPNGAAMGCLRQQGLRPA